MAKRVTKSLSLAAVIVEAGNWLSAPAFAKDLAAVDAKAREALGKLATVGLSAVECGRLSLYMQRAADYLLASAEALPEGSDYSTHTQAHCSVVVAQHSLACVADTLE